MTRTLDKTVLRTLVLVLLSSAGCTVAEAPSESTGRSKLSDPLRAERAQIAASGKYLAARPAASRATGLATLDDPNWAAALDVPDLVTTATLEADPAAAAVLGNLGVITPIRGESFVLLSTGVAGSTAPEPGTDFFPVGTAGDTAVLRLNLHVPPGVNLLSLQYNFLSAEYPDFSQNPDFNDTFTISIVGDPDNPDGTTTNYPVSSVNASQFFAVSNSRAKDTGFDLYATDPAGVDVVFDGNRPDAGLTDFQAFAASVSPDTDIQLVFTIEEKGDGILDSAVLIDAIQFSAIQMLDANPDFVDGNGVVTDDAEQLGDAARGRAVRAGAADGVSKVLLRVKVPGPGSVEFSMPGANVAEDGGFVDAAGVRQPTSSNRIIQTVAGDRYGVAVYEVPEDFNRCPDNRQAPCPDDALSERTITFQARFVGDQSFTTTVDFQLKRPPVVLAHGLWSDSLEWLATPLTDNPTLSITYTNYSYPCDRALRIQKSQKCPMIETADLTNSLLICAPNDGKAIAAAIREAVLNTQRLGVAVTQADVIAHGAAGVHARRYIAQDADAEHGIIAYRNASNMNAGDVNRLITINTPHRGATMADKIVTVRDTPVVPVPDFRCDAAVLSNPSSPVDRSGIDELLTTKLAVVATGLPPTPVPGHALVGASPVGASVSIRDGNRKVGGRGPIYQDVDNGLGDATVFGAAGIFAESHDLFSSTASQRGGLPANAVTPFTMTPRTTTTTIPPDSDFFHSMKFPAMSSRVVELLNSHAGGTLFGTFADAAGFQAGAAASRVASAEHGAPAPQLAATGRLRIVAPVDGANVLSGGTVTVEVVAEDGFVPDSVSVVTGDAVVTKDTPPFVFTLPIPGRSLGPIQLFAVGFSATDELERSNFVALNARTDATVDELRIVTQDPILFGIGTQRQLAVIGRYNDGFTRSINDASTGTLYQSENPQIVTVSADGVLTAIRPGIATVAAQNGAAVDSITVTVKGNTIPLAKAADANAQACVVPGQPVHVQLDASGSFDADGDPLTFTWIENGVELATGPTPTVVLTAGIHTIELVVSDGISDPAHTTISVPLLGDVEAPALTIVGASPAVAECSLAYKDDGATALDLCDGDVTDHVLTQSNVDTSVVGTYAVDYRVTDSAGLTTVASRAVSVEDHTPPALAVVGASPATLECGLPFVDPGASATDICDGDLTAAIVASSHVDPRNAGTYAVDYQVRDRAGLTATVSRAVSVEDHTPPALAVLGANPATLECGLPFTDSGASATDVCDGDLTAAIATTSHVNAGRSGTYSVDYQVRDRAGLTTTASRAVRVADHAAPAITLLGSDPQIAECGLPYQDPGASATDVCDGNLTGTVTATPRVNTRVPGIYTVDYRVQDLAGLADTARRFVLVADFTPPTVSIEPMRELFPADDGYRTFDLSDCATAVDLCTGPRDIDRDGRIVAIHSDERDVGARNDPGRDIVILGDSRFKLRNQRNDNGNGRVYEIELTVRDRFGNRTETRSCFVGVKARRNATPVNDGRVFTVRP